MKSLRWLKWIGLTLLTLLLCVVLAVVAVISTESGRLWLVDRATEFAEKAGVQLEFQNLQTPRLGVWSGDHLKVLQQGQLLVDIEMFELIWRPSALLDRQLLVQKLSAQNVAYYQPSPSTEPNPEEDNQGPSKPPVEIIVEDLQIDRLALHDLVPTPEPLPDYRVQGSLDAFGPDYPLHLQLNIASLDTDDMQLTVDTQAVSEREVRIQGSLREQAGGLIGSLARWPADQPMEADFVATVEQTEDQLRVALEDLQLPLSGHRLQAQGTVSYTSASQTLAVQELLLLIDDQRQKLRGGYSPLDIWAELDLRQLPLDLIQPWVADLQGGSISGEVEMNWLHRDDGRWPHVTADVTGQVIYRQQTLNADLKGRLENKLLTLQPSRVGLEKAQLQTSGSLDFEGSTSDLTGTLSNFDSRLLENWSIPIPENLQARADQTQFRLRGSLQNPTVSIDSAIEGRYQERDFSLTVAGEGSREKARFTRAHLVSGTSDVKAKGTLDWTGNATNLLVNLEHLTEDLLAIAPPAARDSVPEELTFDASGALQVSGALRRPSVQVQGTVTGTYKAPNETLPYRLILDGGVQVGTLKDLKLALERVELAVFDKPTLVLEGNYSAQAMDLNLIMTNLPTRLLAALGWHKVDGEAEADIQLQGTLQNPSINGYFEYRDQLRGRGKRVPVAIHAQMSTEGEDFSLQTTIKHNDEPAGNLTMSLPLGLYLQSQGQQTVPLHLDAKGDWDLRFLRLFIDPVNHRFDGRLAADFTVRGSVQEPVFLGTLKLTQGTYSNAVTGTQLEDIQMTLEGSGQSVLVKDTRASSGDGGYLTLAGEIHWQQQRRQQDDAIALTLEAHDAMILHRRDLQGEIQGQLNVNGSFEELWVKGQMDISPLNASVESAISTSIPEIKVTEVSDEEQSVESSALPIIHLDITLIADQQAYLRGRGLDTELSGRIKVQGTASDPQYRGLFTTRRGQIELFGKRFVLQNGEVRFNNDGVILRIPAVYTASDIEIRAELYGTAEKPQLKLSSIPSRPDDEILARLIFDKPIDQITAFEAIRLAAAVRSLSSGGGFDPVDSARQMLGVDALTIDNSAGENGSGVSVGVGKYLSEKVYLELKRTPNPTQPWQGSVQVELTPKLTLQSGTSEEGGGGAELLWKKDY